MIEQKKKFSVKRKVGKVRHQKALAEYISDTTSNSMEGGLMRASALTTNIATMDYSLKWPNLVTP